MKIDIKVFPRSKRDSIHQEGDLWKVHINAPALDGKANKALLNLLAVHFGIRKSQIEITKGLKSQHKTISIKGI